MVKLTKRKGFNFFRSYFDVYNELNDEDKLAFIDALLNRQFLGIKPENLSGMAKFAYISQTNSIDSQVNGYNDRMRSLGRPQLGEEPLKKPLKDTPPQGGCNTPPQQEKEKGEVQEKEKGEDEEEKNDNNFPLDLDSLFSLDVLKQNYLSNKDIVKAVIENKENGFKNEGHLKEMIDIFIPHLASQGETVKTPKDFAKHFRDWNKKKTTSETSTRRKHKISF